MQVQVSTGVQDLGVYLVTAGGVRRTLAGPGSVKKSSLTVANGSELFIDNARGPVTIHVTGSASGSGQAVFA